MRNIIYVMSVVLALWANSLHAQTGNGFGGVPAPGAASGEPRWPQSFALQGTGEAQYNFAVRSPGTVTVMVQWQGDPVTIAVTKADGEKLYSNFQRSPGQMQIPASVADARRSGAWRLEIYATRTKMDKPGPSPDVNHRVNGSVSVQVPGPAAAPQLGQMPPPLAPGRAGARTGTPPPPPPPPSTANLTQDNYQTCFAYSPGSGGRVAVQCSWRKDWCEEHLRTRTVDGTKYPNMVVVLGCTRGPLYCYSYNNSASGACFADGNECVNNRNSFASQQRGVSVGICRDYTGGVVQN